MRLVMENWYLVMADCWCEEKGGQFMVSVQLSSQPKTVLGNLDYVFQIYAGVEGGLLSSLVNF